jgi:hypothetical protein
MKFNELKSGYTVYLLDKKTMEVSEEKVMSVGAPYPEPMKAGQLAQNLTRLVDVTLGDGGRTHVYAIPEGASVTYAGDTVLSSDSEGVLREVRAMKVQSEELLASVDAHRERVEKCEELIARLDTAYRDKREMDGRLTRVESYIHELKDDIRNLIKELKG